MNFQIHRVFFYILWSSIVHFLWMYFDLSLAKYNQLFLKTNNLLRHNIIPVMNWNWTLDRVWAVYRDLHEQRKCKFKTPHQVHPRYSYRYSRVPIRRHGTVLLFGTLLLFDPIHFPKSKTCLIIGSVCQIGALLGTSLYV